MLWIAGISVLRDGLQFGVMLVLVRLLDARAYGEFSLVSSIVGLLTVLSFHSFLEHTLQARPGDTVDYQAHFTFGGFAQLAAVIALNVVAIVLRQFPAYAAVAPVLSVMSIVFVLDWAAELRVKMLERELNWSRLRLLEAAGILVNALTAIALALGGAGVYALLVPGMAALLPFVYDLFFVMRWRPSWTFNWRAFQPAWRYGLTRMASGVTARGQQVLESCVMAGVLGLPGLGVYGRAIGLASFACLKLTSVMTLTLFPMVTRFLPNSREFQRAGGLVLRAAAWTSIPAAAVLGVVAGPLVRILYGTRWLAAVPLLPWALALASVNRVDGSGGVPAAGEFAAAQDTRRGRSQSGWNRTGALVAASAGRYRVSGGTASRTGAAGRHLARVAPAKRGSGMARDRSGTNRSGHRRVLRGPGLPLGSFTLHGRRARVRMCLRSCLPSRASPFLRPRVSGTD